MNDDYVDGVRPHDALNAPSAVPRDVPHQADPANRFADQMACFDRMRETNLAHHRAHHQPDAATIEWERMREKNAAAVDLVD